jgi:hypothetical protein
LCESNNIYIYIGKGLNARDEEDWGWVRNGVLEREVSLSIEKVGWMGEESV